MAIRIILDTNIFLHFKMLDQIEWEKLLEDDVIELVIIPVMVRELDKHKTENKNKRLRKRAAKRLAWLMSILEERVDSRIRKDTVVVFEHADPILDFKEYRLNPNVEDDFFIAGAIEQFQKFGQSVFIATNDLGLMLKVKAYDGLKLLALPEEFQLQDALDAEDRELQELQKEIAQLKNRKPKLQLCFQDGQTHIEFDVPSLDDLGIDIEEEMRKEKDSHRSMSLFKNIGGGMSVGFVPAIHEHDIEKYNEKLLSYFHKCRRYYEMLEDYQITVSTQFITALMLTNSGSQPATDIDIELQFPTDLKMICSDRVTPCPQKPKEPKKPKRNELFSPTSYLDGLYTVRDMVSDIKSSAINPEDFRTPQEKGPDFDVPKRTISYWIRDLKHHHSYQSEPFVIAFPRRDEIRNFKCDYVVTLKEAPEPITGELHFIFDIK